MAFREWGRRVAPLVLGAVVIVLGAGQAGAQVPEDKLAYDISWPQCPSTLPAGDFAFSITGLNNGYPFSTNDCFAFQYRWAQTAEANPDVYINFDFPSPGEASALDGPYGRCAETDDWCRAYNHGYAIGKDSHMRAQYFGITPGRYWFDVEMINDWSNWRAANGQVVNGAVDYFLEHNLPIGIYGTRYQWGLITGHYMPPVTLPIWVAGATSIEMARERCRDDSFSFAGGVIWMVQYPQDGFDGNVLCEPGRADREGRGPGTPIATAASAESLRQRTASGQAHTTQGPEQPRRALKSDVRQAQLAGWYTVRIEVAASP